MVSTLTVGVNSFATMAEADQVLGDNIRTATKWEATDDDVKVQAMITAFVNLNAEDWPGSQTGVDVVASAIVAAGGTGYAVGALLTFVGGTFGQPAIAKVKTIGGLGDVATLELVDVGTYDDGATPTSPVATTSSDAGTGCTLTVTFQDQTISFPRDGVTNCAGTTLDDTTYPWSLKLGQIMLAFEYVVNAAFDAAAGIGSNLKAVGAGSARVEFFRPTGGQDGSGSKPYPDAVWRHIKCLLNGAVLTGSGGLVSGTDQESTFLDFPGNYGFNQL